MSISDYSRARKLAQKAFRQSLAEGRHPYLQVLDELLPYAKIVGEQDLGLIEIPIERIAGTKTAGRTNAFACNFLPLLEEGTEFADKWSSLYDSHLEEGIREPVIACEFMNSYYIIEGNKRVSVLKYSGAAAVSGYVTRIVPAYDENSPEIRIYYEFMEFFRASGINEIYFSRPGCFKALCKLLGKRPEEVWTVEERRDFSSALFRFTRIFQALGGKKLPITPGDGFLMYVNVYGYEDFLNKSQETIKKELTPLWNDLEALPSSGNVNVVMQPQEEPEKTLIRKLAGPETTLIKKLIAPASARLHVGFLYYKTAETSSWTYSHNLGRLYLEENLAGRVVIHVYDGIVDDAQCTAGIEQARADGCTVIFTTSPRFLGPSIKAAMKYPELKILNCSLNSYSGHMRTYYGRLYESKFLVGLLAGILTDTDHIGYIADFPIYGEPAAINAFALGVKMVNPAALIHLAWSSEKDCDVDALLKAARVSHISGRDTITPLHSSRRYGLYDMSRDGGSILAACIWHWGKFYQRILLTILNGTWNRTSPASLGRSINYWWGISSGMIDMITSKEVPKRTLQLVELVKKQIVSGEFQIFSGDISDQNQVLRCKGSQVLTPEEIIRMDWLADNVIGKIPAITDLVEEAIPTVRIQGIYADKEDF